MLLLLLLRLTGLWRLAWGEVRTRSSFGYDSPITNGEHSVDIVWFPRSLRGLLRGVIFISEQHMLQHGWDQIQLTLVTPESLDICPKNSLATRRTEIATRLLARANVNVRPLEKETRYSLQGLSNERSSIPIDSASAVGVVGVVGVLVRNGQKKMCWQERER